MSSRDQAAAAFIASIATACDGAFLGLTVACVAASSWVKYLASSSALRRICHAPSARVSDLRSLLSSSDDDNAGRLVVVRGQVQPKSAADSSWPPPKNYGALVSQGSGESAVLVEHTQTCLYNECMGLFGWNFDLHAIFVKTWKEQRASSLRTVPFGLVEGGRWPNSGFVHVSLDGSTHPLPLTTVYDHLHPVESTPYSFILSFFGHRYPVALLDEEKILPVGKEITAVGICKTQDGALEIKSCPKLPWFLSDMTKDEIEADLTINTKILFWSGILLGTLSVSILGYAIIRNWQKWKESRRRNQELPRRQNQDVPDEELDPSQSSVDEELDLEDVPDGELCVICRMRLRIYAFVPCGHRVCCRPCTISLQSEAMKSNSTPNCPVCRQSIRSSIRIYNS